MINFEQVEKLSKHAEIPYEEAKRVLEEANGDLLQAVINLERQGRIKSPKAGGYYNSQTSGHQEQNRGQEHNSTGCHRSTFGDLIRSFWQWLKKVIHKGNTNTF